MSVIKRLNFSPYFTTLIQVFPVEIWLEPLQNLTFSEPFDDEAQESPIMIMVAGGWETCRMTYG